MTKASAKPFYVVSSLAVVAAISAFLFLLHMRDDDPNQAPIVIHVGTNGLPTLFGVPLGKGLGRDVAFWALHASKLRVSVATPGYAFPMYPGVDANFVQTLSAINKAQLLPSRPPPGPSPFE